MKSNSNLLSVVMDGIRDANMLYDYADTACAEGNATLRDWFRKKADERASRTADDWKDAKAVLQLDTKSDEMSACLKSHVQRQLSYLRGRTTK